MEEELEMKRTKTLIKDWQNVCINCRKTESKTGTAPEVIARFTTQCALDKELKTEDYWRAFIEGTERLGTGSQQAVNQRHQAEELARAGDYHSAIRVLFHVLAIDPWNAATYCEIGEVFYAMGAPAKAIKAYWRSLALNPNDFECHYRLGMAHLLGEDPCAAAIALARAIKLKPDYSEAYDQLAFIYRKYGYHHSAKLCAPLWHAQVRG
jgi:Flp pilus assembly protein TadD